MRAHAMQPTGLDYTKIKPMVKIIQGNHDGIIWKTQAKKGKLLIKYGGNLSKIKADTVSFS